MVVEPPPDHARIVRILLRDVGVGGNLVDHAHLPALAIEHRCSVVSFDHDFGRLERVHWGPPPP